LIVDTGKIGRSPRTVLVLKTLAHLDAGVQGAAHLTLGSAALSRLTTDERAGHTAAVHKGIAVTQVRPFDAGGNITLMTGRAIAVDLTGVIGQTTALAAAEVVLGAIAVAAASTLAQTGAGIGIGV
jgi:hypothetical protein